MKEFIVKRNDVGQRLDRFIGKTVPLLPEALLQKYIRIKRIKVNDKGAKRDYRLNEGDILKLYINDEFFEKPREDNAYLKVNVPKLDIVYEDENILLVDKKPGILCHSAGTWDYNTLVSHVQAYTYQKGEWSPRSENNFAPALCNRIDRNTGGIVIAAKNAEALRIINEKIRLHEVEKSYLCVVLGKPKEKSGTLNLQLWKDASKNQVFVKNKPEAGSKTSITHYNTICTKGDLSLVECVLETGRTHQIRVSMAHIGCPLLGDGKYGIEKVNKRYNEAGQLLYSYKLDFDFSEEKTLLDYLKNRQFKLANIDFVEKYFSGTIF